MAEDHGNGGAFPTFEAACAEGVLALLTCADCGERSLLPRAACPSCLSEDLDWRPTVPAGSIRSMTRVHRPASPDIAPGYRLALLRLDEGPQLLARLEGPEASIDARAVVVFGPPDAHGNRLPVIRLDEGSDR
jgi:uncharacterized OB-fold protein